MATPARKGRPPVWDFVLRARKAPTTAALATPEPGDGRFLEVVSHCVVSALFASRRARADTTIHLAFDGPAAPPKVVRLAGAELGSLPGLDERSIWQVLRQALERGQNLALAQSCPVGPGIWVTKMSFEQLVRERLAAGPVYAMAPAGDDIRTTPLEPPASFLFTDHLAMPRKQDRYLTRLGVRALSVGPEMLLASHCMVVVHNELDRRGAGSP